MTTEFKTGDRVRCVEVSWDLVDGAVYEVTCGKYLIEVRPIGDHPSTRDLWRPERFVPAIEGISFGDTVRVVEEHWLLPVGKDLLVSAVGPSHLGSPAGGRGGSLGLTFDPNNVDVIKRASATKDAKSEPEPEPDETLDSFKRRVWDAAQAAKKEHGWCSKIDKIVADLGVAAPTRRYRITIPIEVDVTGVDLRGTRQLRHKADVIGALRNLGIERSSSAEVVESSLYTGHWKIEEIAR